MVLKGDVMKLKFFSSLLSIDFKCSNSTCVWSLQNILIPFVKARMNRSENLNQITSLPHIYCYSWFKFVLWFLRHSFTFTPLLCFSLHIILISLTYMFMYIRKKKESNAYSIAFKIDKQNKIGKNGNGGEKKCVKFPFQSPSFPPWLNILTFLFASSFSLVQRFLLLRE